MRAPAADWLEPVVRRSRVRNPQAPPAKVVDVFGDRAALATRYAEILTSAGVERGLLGPREADRIWDRHLFNCAAVSPLIPSGDLVCDVGSGAGLPGIVIAITRPDLRMVLLEPLLRRTTFLGECVTELALHNVTVIRGRAEEYAGRMNADSVVARAVAPLERLAGWALPLLRPGGQLLAMKGETARAELDAAKEHLLQLGAGEWELLGAGLDSGAQPTHVVRILAAGPTTARAGRARRRQ
jgi:16S rRNA (guanine527-N7)-methyltransferase